MKLTPEINIKTQTKPIGKYGIEDMKKMFGKRIEKAIYVSEVDKSGRCYSGLIHREIRKICVWWKFWNRDIAKAYENYQGMVLVPFIIQDVGGTVISENTNWISKKMIDAYSKGINENYYG